MVALSHCLSMVERPEHRDTRQTKPRLSRPQEVLMSYRMSESATARKIDSELGALEGDLPGGAPLLSYLRYNVDLQPAAIRSLLGDEANTIALENLSAMDAPENMSALHRLGIVAGQRNCR